jgi:predicted dehydrogenase
MEAGKDVYVEKPLSHSQWEGEQTVAAARKYDRVCQIGTQQRSDPMQAEIKKFLHDEKNLGEIQSARVNRYGIRKPIGKRSSPMKPPKNVKYDLWLGPAADTDLRRQNFHYDWHWDYNTGSGEMGNWGVHVLDDVRNNIFLDKVILPTRVMGGGGRVAWNDAGTTPNVHFAYFDTGTIPVVIGLSNLANSKSSKSVSAHPGPRSGYIAYCEGGRLEGERGEAKAFDNEGNVIKTFQGNSGGMMHAQNFIDAVRARDASMLNADVQTGHDSTGWCNLANITHQTGHPFAHSNAAAIDADVWNNLVGEMESLLERHEIDIQSDAIQLSGLLEIDSETQRFVGENADVANRFLKREYREGFEVPEIAMATAEQ